MDFYIPNHSGNHIIRAESDPKSITPFLKKILNGNKLLGNGYPYNRLFMTYIQCNNWDVEIVWPKHVLGFVTICKLILPLPVLSTRWWNVSLVVMFLIYYYTSLSFSWFLTCLIWHTIVFSSIFDTMLPIICYYSNETTINTWVCFIVEI